MRLNHSTTLVGTLLRYPYEVRSEEEYFDEIRDAKVTKDMLDLAKHIVNQKSGSFEPEKFEDHYEDCADRPHQQQAAGKPITPKERPAAGNFVNLMEALRRTVGQEQTGKTSKSKKPKKASGRRRCRYRSLAKSRPRKGRQGSQRRGLKEKSA